MATIEELDFQLVLQDNEFDKKVNKLKNDAQKLNTQLSALLTVMAAARVVSPEDLQNMQKMNALLEEQNKTESKLNNRRKKRVELEREITAELQKQAATGANVPTNVTIDNSKTINNMRTAQEGFNKEVSKSSKLWMQLKNLTTAYFSVMGASRLISNLVRVSAEFEKQRISLEAILKDVNGADKIFNQMKELAVQSPFQFKELVTYTKQLSAFSVPMEELYDTTKMLADISAGLGVGMDRLILAYGQIRSASFLRGQEVRQLTEAGVPILEELRKQFEAMGELGITAGQVFDKISARQVTFEMVEKVFKGMTEEGGKFYKMQEVLATTLSGKISNLKDAYQIMFAEIGEKSNGILVKSVDALRSLAENYEKVGRAMLAMVASFGVYKTGVLISTISNWMKLGKAANSALPLIKGFTIAMKENATAMKLVSALSIINPYAALATGIIAAGAAIFHFMKEQNQAFENQKAINKAVEEYNADIENESAKLQFLVKQLDKAEKGTAQYEVAKKKIIDNYGQYLSDIDRENLALGNQVDLYEKLVPALQKAAREKAMDTGLENIGNIYTQTRAGLQNDFQKLINYIKSDPELNVSQAVAEELGMYFRSEINEADFSDAGKEIYRQITDGMREEGSLLTSAYNNQFTNNYTFDVPFNINQLRQNLAQADEILEAGRQDLIETMNIIYGPDKPTGDEVLKPWQESINAILKEAEKNKIVLSLKVDSSLDNVIGEVKERLEDTSSKAQQYAGIEDGIAESYRKQWQYYQRINQEVLKGRATPGGGGSSTSKDSRVDQIKEEINAYKTLKEAYQSLVEYMDETAARDGIRGLAGVLGVNAEADFDAEIDRLIFELGGLGEAGEKAAQSLLGSLAMDAFKKYQEEAKAAAEATKEFEEMLKEMDDVYSLAGYSGVSLDIAKIQKNYRDAVKVIAEERAQAIESLDREALKGRMSDTEYENNLNRIFGFFDIQEANERAESIDKVRDAIKKYYTEARDGAIDFTNLSDKSLAQLKRMKDVLSELAYQEIDPKLMEGFKEMGITIDDVIAVTEKLVQGDLAKLDEETQKLKLRDWREIAKGGEELGQSIEQLGEAAGNVTLSNIGSMLSQMSELAGTILSAMESGNWVGAFATVAISAANKVFQNMAKAAQAAARLREEIRGILVQGYLDDLSNKIELSSTLFGDSFLSKVRATNDAIKALKKDIENIFSSTGGSKEGSLMWWMQQVSKLTGISIFADNGAINTEFLEVMEKTQQQGWFQFGDDFKNLKDLNEALNEMFKELDATISDIFSDMGESITDELINKLWETGEVVSDLEDVFQNLGNTIMKSLIQSFVVDEVLNKYKEQVKSWFTTDMSADRLAEEVDRFANNVREDIDASGEVIKAIFDAFNTRNIISNGGATDSGLANGIKGVTEETASLLASYINAIRADVAYNRLQLEDVRGDVRLMLGLLPQSPTLAEYLTQIQANTYNSAERAQEILLHLESLTTTTGGASALRVYM